MPRKVIGDFWSGEMERKSIVAESLCFEERRSGRGLKGFSGEKCIVSETQLFAKLERRIPRTLQTRYHIHGLVSANITADLFGCLINSSLLRWSCL